MKIIRDDNLGTLTLVPVSETEKKVFAQMIPVLNKGDKFTYGGHQNDERFCKVLLYIHSTTARVTNVIANVTFTQTVEEGGIYLLLEGTTEDDKRQTACIRYFCFYIGKKPIFLYTTLVDGEKSIVITLTLCKHCGSQIINLDSCRWSTCDSCRMKTIFIKNPFTHDDLAAAKMAAGIIPDE